MLVMGNDSAPSLCPFPFQLSRRKPSMFPFFVSKSKSVIVREQRAPHHRAVHVENRDHLYSARHQQSLSQSVETPRNKINSCARSPFSFRNILPRYCFELQTSRAYPCGSLCAPQPPCRERWQSCGPCHSHSGSQEFHIPTAYHPLPA